MTDREKLVKLLSNVEFQYTEIHSVTTENVAGYLISKGVTFATDTNAEGKWIPVSERFPEANGFYLCVVCISAANQRKEYRRMVLFWEENVWIDMPNCFKTKKPLYWMPLPEPPREGE